MRPFAIGLLIAAMLAALFGPLAVHAAEPYLRFAIIRQAVLRACEIIRTIEYFAPSFTRH